MDNLDLLFRFKSILRSILTNSVCQTRVLLAVSGGVDSVVMLDLFDSAKDEFNLQIGVATLNHKLRKEAQEEVKFVERLCRDRGLDFFTDEVDVLRYSKEHKLSIEEAARILRYGFLINVADNYCYKYIATAHNSNDLLETMILRLVKGTGPYGLAGMNLVNGRFIRPLLFFKREEIEKYARHKDLSFVIDTSNYDIKYNRNFIRHEVIPLLKEINPSVEDASLKLAKGIWELEKYVNSTIQSFNEKHSMKIGEYIVFKLHKDKYLQVEQIRSLAL
ncbi:MAG: tRNA lysidine(34) synthetase TilS, partial [Fervidobacterium sp.]